MIEVDSDSYILTRPVRRQDDFVESQSFIKSRKANFIKTFKFNCKEFIIKSFPIIEWLSEYHLSRDLPMDIIAGITVTVLQIPQGLAYAFLANIPSIFGLYTAFFPSIMYFLFGTSRHINLGTFAVVCLMVGQCVATHSVLDENGNKLDEILQIKDNGVAYKNTEVLSAITFTTSSILLIMYICRFGILVSILSDTLINAFTTACVVHLIASQLKEFFGLSISATSRTYFKVGFTVYEICQKLPETNFVTVIIGSISLSVLIIYNVVCKPWLSKKCRFPIPVEFLVCGIVTAVSYIVDLEGKFGVTLVGSIPTGIPYPVVPTFELMPNVIFDSFLIALVTYIITISMAFILARKSSYIIHPNQELLAMGMMDLIGSFFYCVPVSASLSRSVVQHAVGGVSQIALIISALLILLILLWAGPLLEYLPKCILTSIIISAVYTLFYQVRDLKKFWLLSKLDAMIWIVTFLSTVIIDIRIGLLMGIASAIFVICYHSFTPNSYIMGLVPGTEIYLSKDRFKASKEIDNIKIFRYEGGINFATKTIYRNHLFIHSQVNVKKIIVDRAKLSRKLKSHEQLPPLKVPIAFIILDFSAVTHIDPEGCKMLRNLENDYETIGVFLLIAAASGDLVEKLRKFNDIECKEHLFKIFPTIHDAVLFAKGHR